MRLHDRFEWDAAKATANLAKHRVSFDRAAEMLGDDEADAYHIHEFDEGHSEAEPRYITLASHPADRGIVVRVVWTDRSARDDRVTRIISARPATRRERRKYAEAIWG